MNTEHISKTDRKTRANEKNNKHECDICNKSEFFFSNIYRMLKENCIFTAFRMISTLKDHLRVHSKEKPFICSICGKGFSQKTNMRQHVNRHNKEKSFQCTECTSSFVTKGELQTHQRKHNGEHPFKCKSCDSAFTTSSSLVRYN